MTTGWAPKAQRHCDMAGVGQHAPLDFAGTGAAGGKARTRSGAGRPTPELVLVPDRLSPPECEQPIDCLAPMVATEHLPLIHSERVVRTVLIVDVVESVRLMEEDEEGVVQRWLRLVDHVVKDRLVKSTGDGMLLEFARVQSAMTAAFAIQRASDIANLGLPGDRRMLLRMGAQVGELIADERDVYGRGVNLAARLTTLAGPGEIVVSAGVRDQLTPILDADVEDLGECFVKHMD